MELYARQGDLVIEKLTGDQTGEFRTVTNPVFAGDSSGHPHRLIGTVQVQDLGNGRRVVRLTAPATLVHAKPDGHRDVVLPAGDYEIRVLRERGGSADRAVAD